MPAASGRGEAFIARELADGLPPVTRPGARVAVQPGGQAPRRAAHPEVERGGTFGQDPRGGRRAGGDGREAGAGMQHDDAASGGQGFQRAPGLVAAIQRVASGAGLSARGRDQRPPPPGTGEAGGTGGGQEQDGATLPILDFAAFAALGLIVNLLFPMLAVLAALAVGLGGRTVLARETVTKLRFQAERDSLTGLLNRTGWAEWLHTYRRQMSRRGGGLLVLLGDLDGFKAVNDTLGHPAGDQLLREVGLRLQHAVRPGDVVARLGGDEFALAVHMSMASETADVMPFIDRVMDHVTQPYSLDGGLVRVGLSLGAARWPQDGVEITEVMALADQALYAAKRAGKGRVAFHGVAAVE